MADPRAFMSFDFDHDEYQRTFSLVKQKTPRPPSLSRTRPAMA